ncbi:OMP85 family outer membrane protein [Alcanivorax sp. S71-1-4]|jgi:hemolysin activation/secretion protein|uniref:ShlB/FhaC/HecB family hemolysin secretion/activation protein n=1 Tax=Alcanivorax sp. S71-1-4 TaxID=1177159 RepID=UPI00135A058E|nr:ShlB/FhaC/HecB family hemolysin secretion/activation protein [Alcanivorax sp. S71-1-4]KAF0806101.1 OMP85 family outer membrane protein [Alcanivorax sp. S71-1-4]
MQSLNKLHLLSGVVSLCLLVLAGSVAQAQTAGEEQVAPAPDSEALMPTVTIREYIVRGNSVLSTLEIQRAVYPFLGEGRTLTDIEAARDALQQVYQQKGYQSVFVELPEQQVSGGIVFLQVGETRIGRVRVMEAEYTSPLEIRKAVPALEEGSVPNFELVQSQLTALSGSGKRQVVPVVREGALPGTMDVDLNVDDSSPWYGSLSLNNDYSADTTQLRAVATVGHDNLWQKNHQVSLTLFTAPEETDDAMVWSGNYTAPLSERWNLRVSGYTSDSDVATVGGTTVIGKGSTYGVSLIHTWPFANNWVHSVSAGIDVKDFDEQIGLGGDMSKVPLKYAPLSLSYTGYRFTDVSQADVNLTLLSGFRSVFGYGSSEQEFEDKRYRASPSFTVLKLGGGYTRTFAGDWQAALNSSLQFASGPLVANEQFSAGGASSVRGYLSAEATGDNGGLGSIELRTPSLSNWYGPDLNEWRLYLFAEGARLEVLDVTEEQRRVFRLASAGVGTRAQFFDWLSWGVDMAWPLRRGPNTEEYDPHVHFNVRASF